MKKTPPGTGGALKGFKNMKRFLKFKPVRPAPQPPCVSTLPQAWKHLGAAVADPTFRRTERVHALGPRAVGEPSIELEADPHTLDRRARSTPAMLHATGGNRWPTSRMLMAVARDPWIANGKHVSVLPASWRTLAVGAST